MAKRLTTNQKIAGSSPVWEVELSNINTIPSFSIFTKANDII